jgi:hypothetical protein
MARCEHYSQSLIPRGLGLCERLVDYVSCDGDTEKCVFDGVEELYKDRFRRLSDGLRRDSSRTGR